MISNSLSVWDYVVFGVMLLGSSVIGLYHGFQSNRKRETSKEDYLLAGQNMGWFPLFVSLVASYLSAIALLGVPSEIYTYGGMYIVVMFSYPLFIIQCIFIYAPIFRRSKVTSANEVRMLVFISFRYVYIFHRWVRTWLLKRRKFRRNLVKWSVQMSSAWPVF